MPEAFYVWGGLLCFAALLGYMIYGLIREAIWWWFDRRVEWFDPEKHD